eukprot:4476296-Alexandrium_andersonii.AAC.1
MPLNISKGSVVTHSMGSSSTCCSRPASRELGWTIPSPDRVMRLPNTTSPRTEKMSTAGSPMGSKASWTMPRNIAKGSPTSHSAASSTTSSSP